MSLNNEIDTLNVHNLDNDIRDTATRNMIAPTEKESYATNDYKKNQYLIWNDRKLYKATTTITHGDTLTIGGNIRYIGTLSEEVYNLHVSSDEGIRELIANIEEANASKAYYFGDYIVRAADGLLYMVTTNVSLGTAWAVGTNIQLVDNVASVLTDLKQGVHKTQQMIATVEVTNKASKSYEVGDEFVFNNKLVKATAHIEQQATITLGTNCTESDSIADRVANIDAAKSMVSNISANRHGRVIMIGDSYANTSGYYTQVASMLGVSDRATIKYLGGTGFTKDASGYSGNNGFLRLLTEGVNGLTAAQREDVTDVIICGGYNDSATFPNGTQVSAVETGITNVKNYVDANLPNATLHIAMIGVVLEGYAQGITKTIDDLLFTEYMYMNTCTKLNIHYMTSPKYAMTNPYYGDFTYIGADGVHPQPSAAHFIARMIVNGINHNESSITMPTFYSPATITSEDGSWSSNLGFDYEVIGEIFKIRWYAKSIGANIDIAENDRRVKVAHLTMPRAVWFNHTHIAYMHELAVISGVRKQCSIQMEFHEDICDVYMITPNSGNLSLFNLPYGEISVNLYAK